MEHELEKKQREEEAKEEEIRAKVFSLRRSQAIATPGRSANATPRFMPKKRGRLGL